MISLEQLIDATNYEWEETETGFAWVEDGNPLHVEIMNLEGGVVSVVNTECGSGIAIPETSLLTYGALAVDYVQFIEYANREDYTFTDVADAIMAMGCDYGFSGSDCGLGISLEYGAWLEIANGRYMIYDDYGFTYHAATPEGCKRAWAKRESNRQQIAWAEAEYAKKGAKNDL